MLTMSNIVGLIMALIVIVFFVLTLIAVFKFIRFLMKSPQEQEEELTRH
jgi:flagellar biosynthesis/type III secretory pathway M-ring protein FliF/YscJ